MTFSHLPATLATPLRRLAAWLGPRVGARLAPVLVGILFAAGRRTATSWFRAGGVGRDFRPAYYALASAGRAAHFLSTVAFDAAAPVVTSDRLTVALDDTPTARYGPCVEGAGLHHDPTPGPAGAAFVYGHVWVCLAVLAQHDDWGVIALPILADLYVRRADLDKLPPGSARPFLTKLELAARQLTWLKRQASGRFRKFRVVVDGAYAKKPFLAAARREGFEVAGRLRKDAALRDLPPARRNPGPGRPRIYGPKKISLAKRAGQKRGWSQVECVQYGKTATKTVKTFVATWRPAGGAIRVVLVREYDGWRAFFSTDPGTSAAEILEAVADRNAQEQSFKDVKEVWGAGQQQVRNVDASVGCFNLNQWMYTLVEAWAWGKSADELVDRSQSPWDDQPRRPSHRDRRKALQREALRGEIEAALAGTPSQQEMRELGERLLRLAA